MFLTLMTISFVTFVAWCRLYLSNICLMISKRYIYTSMDNLTNIFPRWSLMSFRSVSWSSSASSLFVCAVGLHHLRLLSGDHMLLFAGFFSWRGPGQEVSGLGRYGQGGGLGGEGWSWSCRRSHGHCKKENS